MPSRSSGANVCGVSFCFEERESLLGSLNGTYYFGGIKHGCSPTFKMISNFYLRVSNEER